MVAIAVLAGLAWGVVTLIASGGSSSRSAFSARRHATGSGRGRAHPPADSSTSTTRRAPTTPPLPRPSPPFAVGMVVLRLVDGTRSVKLASGQVVPRTLVTDVRYPAFGPPGRGDRLAAPAARSGGPFPLIVFGHGFAETPATYAPLLRAWAAAGYVVAAPAFPLSNADAPGGAGESDLSNQPADMRLVISRVLAAGEASSGALGGLVDRGRIAVAGHSDGGDSALAVGYDPPLRDPRVGAAVILSGAEIPALAGFQLPPGGPPLLATQGTADPINSPNSTSAFFDTAPAPKYLLELLGASHLPPYSSEEPQLGVVQRVTIAFLDAYLKQIPGSRQRLLAAGMVPGVASLNAKP